MTIYFILFILFITPIGRAILYYFAISMIELLSIMLTTFCGLLTIGLIFRIFFKKD